MPADPSLEDEKVDAPVVQKGRKQSSGQEERTPRSQQGGVKKCFYGIKDCFGSIFALWRSFGEEFHEMVHYVGFLTIFCVVIFSPRSADPYRLQVALEDYFLNTGGKYFSQITSIPDAYTWLQTGLVPNLYPERDFFTGKPFERGAWNPNTTTSVNATIINGTLISAGDDTDTEDQTLTNLKALLKGSNRRIGKVQLRLIRVRDDSCGIMKVFSDSLESCYSDYDEFLSQATDRWKNYTWASAQETGHSRWYSTATKIYYTGAGYKIDLPNDHSEVMDIVQTLYDERFIDFSARALFVDFTVYNANVDLVAVVRLVLEFTASGAVFPTEDIRVNALLRPYRVLTNDGVTTFESGIFILELVFFGIVFFYIAEEFKEYWEQGFYAYFGFWWNWVEIFNLSIFVIVLILKMVWIGYIFSYKGKFTVTDEYVNLVDLSWFVKQVDNLYAFNAVITFFKLFKFLRHNPDMAQLTKTIGKASAEMMAVIAIMTVLGCGYGTAFHLAFGRNTKEFLDFPESAFAMVRFALGDFDLVDLLNSENSGLGIFLFVSFIITMGFVMLSIFVAVVSSAYDRVRVEISQQTDPLTKDIMRVARAPADAIWTVYSAIKYIFTGIDLRHPRDMDKEDKETTFLLEKEKEEAERQQMHEFYQDIHDRITIMDQIQEHLKESLQGICARLQSVQDIAAHDSFQLDEPNKKQHSLTKSLSMEEKDD